VSTDSTAEPGQQGGEGSTADEGAPGTADEGAPGAAATLGGPSVPPWRARRAGIGRTALTDRGWAVPAGVALILFVLWSAHDGGYDADTWYWGALVLLALLAASLAGAFGAVGRLATPVKLALGGFAFYVLWSYASILWAGYPGDALTGSNRSLLYLVLFAGLAVIRWTPRRALWMLSLWAIGVGVVGALILIDMAQGRNVANLFNEGRLITPTGYFNSDAALFMMLALVGTGLSVRRELPIVLRGVLLACGCAGLQLALLAESRGWLFTMPLVLLLGLLAVRDRLALTVAAVAPVIGLLAVLHPLLHVYDVSVVNNPRPATIVATAEHAGKVSLLACLVVLVVGIVGALTGPRALRRRPSARSRKLIGIVAAAAVIVVAVVGASAATHGHPVRFLNRQWYGFTHPANTTTLGSGSHFAAVGTERYDAWRVTMKAFEANPIGGLGQDNFADYYVLHRHTSVELQWTHSLEMRLLAHTGAIGTVAFLVFLIGALCAAIRNRRDPDPLARAVAGVALLPLIVWIVHGSVDWFWEIPALSGPALGFLAVAGSVTAGREPPVSVLGGLRSALARRAVVAGGLALLVVAVLVLGFPYLAQRELSIGSDLRSTNPAGALAAYARSGDLNPLSSDPGRSGGTAALRGGFYTVAIRRFDQAIAREPGGWFSWLGAGLAESALGNRRLAHHDFQVAASINDRQPAVTTALARVDSAHPLTAEDAMNLLVLAH
jgi:hypothetical protein